MTFYLLLIAFATVKSDNSMHTSTVDVKELIQNQIHVMNHLKTVYLSDKNKEDTRFKPVERYMDEFERLVNNGNKYLNVLFVYKMFRLIRRENLLIVSIIKETCLHSDTILNRIKIPSQDDVDGVGVAIIRLQDIYELNTSSLVAGIIRRTDNSDYDTVVKLTANDCFHLGQLSLNNKYYGLALDWLKIIFSFDDADNDTKATAKKLLKIAGTLHDSVLNHRGTRGPDWQTKICPYSSSKRCDADREDYFQIKLQQQQDVRSELEHFMRLCRGRKLLTSKQERQLYCYYRSSSNLYQLISPFKVELVSNIPEVYVFHDVLLSSECSMYQELANNRLQTSSHYGATSPNKAVIDLRRTSKIAWLQDDEHVFLKKMTKKYEILTGLGGRKDLYEAEGHQVANYGIGGHYVPHFDFHYTQHVRGGHKAWNDFIGDRLATLMIYLSDTDDGGFTAFPAAGIAVKPKMGDAVFWWNLTPEGRPIMLTRHGACPVLLGTKWVMNKWFHYPGQMFRRPCRRNGL